MDLQFKKTVCSCLERVIWDAQNQEQTQEVKLPDALPDIGSVLASWGQCVLRSKEWRGGSLIITGGVMTRTLYAAPEEETPVCIDAWIPFQIKRDFPETEHEGIMRASCLLQSVDARTVSARKLMVRVNVSVLTEALAPVEREVYAPEDDMGDVQLLRRTYPLQLPKEAGEKTFLLDEDLTMPATAPAPEKLISYVIQPELLDQKVVGGRIVFRGTAVVHVLYQSEEGELYSCNLEIPFSQFTELDQEFGAESQVHIIPAVTSLELELDEDEHLHLKCGLVAQYVVSDRVMLDLVEDAYSPHRSVKMTDQLLYLPVTLEQRKEVFHMEQELPDVNGELVELTIFADHPRMIRSGETASLELNGAFQALYRNSEGKLRSSFVRVRNQRDFALSVDAAVQGITMCCGQLQATGNGSGMTAAADLSVDMCTVSDRGMPMVTGLDIGELTEPDPGRPSLILRRAGDEPLWDLAKRCGSTVDAIRQANKLQSEPVNGQILLIPVP